VKVQNMLSSSSNQFIVIDMPAGIANKENRQIPQGDMFQSHDSVIAFRDFTGQIYLDTEKYDYSNTTMRYLAKFLGHGIKETRKLIKSGKYILVDFNG